MIGIGSILFYLPEDIFIWIRNYLSHDDYHYLLNTSKHQFADIKRRTIYFTLNKQKSKLYLTDKIFQSLLLSKVENGWNQISIQYDGSSLSCTDDIPPIHHFEGKSHIIPHYLWNKFHSFSGTLSETSRELPPLTNVKALDLNFQNYAQRVNLGGLSHLTKLTLLDVLNMDITPLQHIPDLRLSSRMITGLENTTSDFSMFKNQKRLELFNCLNLTNVTTFRTIRTLNLYKCDNLQDVRPLYGIYDLTLNWCECVKDISGLGNHHRLTLKLMSSSLTGYERLLHIPNVILHHSNITDLTVLQYAKVVSLRGCDKELDVGPLSNVKKLDIQTHSVLVNLDRLGNIPSLSLQLEDASNEVNDELLPYLNNRRLCLLARKWNITSFSSFSSSIQDLTIGRSGKLAALIHEGKGVKYFEQLQFLTLEQIDGLNTLHVDGFADIPNVTLVHCHELHDLNGLGGNRSVDLDCCWGLRDVSSIAKVPIVTLNCCSDVKDVESLSKVPRLKILNNVGRRNNRSFF